MELLDLQNTGAPLSLLEAEGRGRLAESLTASSHTVNGEVSPSLQAPETHALTPAADKRPAYGSQPCVPTARPACDGVTGYEQGIKCGSVFSWFS